MDIMNLLRTFVAVADEGNMVKAADTLTYAQPTVSLHLKALEEHFGTPLLQYRDKRYELTEEGQVLYDYATTLLHLVREAHEAISEFRDLERGSLKVGATSNIGVYVLPVILSRFRRKYPKVEVTVAIDKSWTIQKQVLRGELNVGIVEAHARETPQLAVEPWYEDPLVLIASPNHPWAEVRAVRPDELGQYLFVTGEQGSGTRTVLESQLGASAGKIRVAMQLGSTEAVKRAVESNLGVSIVTKSSVTREIELGTLRSVDIEGTRLCKTFQLVYPKNRHLTAATKRFLTEMRALKERVMPLELDG